AIVGTIGPAVRPIRQPTIGDGPSTACYRGCALCLRSGRGGARAHAPSLAGPSSGAPLGGHCAVLGRYGAEHADSWRSAALCHSRHTAPARPFSPNLPPCYPAFAHCPL